MFYLFNVNYSIFIYFCVFISIKLLTVAHFQKTQTGLRWLRRAHPASDAELYMQGVLYKIKRSSLRCPLVQRKFRISKISFRQHLYYSALAPYMQVIFACCFMQSNIAVSKAKFVHSVIHINFVFIKCYI